MDRAREAAPSEQQENGATSRRVIATKAPLVACRFIARGRVLLWT